MLVSVILPTYNEKDNIESLIRQLRKFLKSNNYEIIVVDDNSPDGTWKIAKRLERGGRVRVIVRKERGLATAVFRGIEQSKGDVVVVMDTDLSHPPRLVPKLLKAIRNFDMVIASRYIEGGGSESHLSKFTAVLNFFLGLVLGLKTSDLTGGFFAARKIILTGANKRVFSGYGDYFFKMMYFLKNRNVRVAEIPFVYKKRMRGKSKTRALRTGVRYFMEALKLRLGLSY